MRLLLTLFICCMVHPVFCQVNLNTGAAEASFSLFQLKDNIVNTSVGVQLRYVAGNGYRTDDIASNVGTGWALDVGGEITRTVIGEPDDQKYQGSITVDMNTWYSYPYYKYYPDGNLHTSFDKTVPGFAAQHLMFPKNIFHDDVQQALKAAADREMDIFSFNFNGRKGQFYIGKDRSILQLNDSRLKISFSEKDMTNDGIRTTINSFTVTDENGYRYRFNSFELTDLCFYKEATFNKSFGIYAKVYEANGIASTHFPKIVSKWFLTSIEKPFTGEQVQFVYEDYDVDMQGARHYEINSLSVQVDRYKYHSKRLKRIQCSDKKRLDFIYKNEERLDLPGDNAIDKIELQVDDGKGYSVFETIQFNVGYFYKDNIRNYVNHNLITPLEKSYARLALNNFQRIGRDGQMFPATQFEYFLYSQNQAANDVPRQFSIYKDALGYFNGFSGETNDSGPFEYNMFEASEFDLKAGMLKKIAYPEGGSLEYIFEKNSTGDYNKQIEVTGLRVKELISQNLANKKTTHYSYVLPDGSSSGFGFEAPVNKTSKINRIYQIQISAEAAFFIKAIGAPVFDNEILQIALGTLGNLLIKILSKPYEDNAVELISTENKIQINPLPILYSRVITEERSGNLTNGKTIYTFTDYMDYPVLVPKFQFPYTLRQRAAFWQYGLPKSIEYLNSTGTKVKEVVNDFNMIVHNYTEPEYLSVHWEENTAAFTKYDYDPLSLPASLVTTESYYPVTGRAELIKSTETSYDKNQNTKTVVTKFNYNKNNFQLADKESFVYGTDISYGESFYYPEDYNTKFVTEVQPLISSNLVNEMVAGSKWLRKNNTIYIKSATANTYDVLPSGRVALSKVYYTENNAPVAGSFFDSKVPAYSFNIMKLKAENIYEDDVLTEQRIGKHFQKELGPLPPTVQQTTTFISDKTHQFIIAEIQNSRKNEIAYSGFEEDNNGNWITDNSAINTTESYTGSNSYDLSKANLQWIKPVFTSNNHMISLWYKNGNVQVNGQAVNLVRTVNGWNFGLVSINSSSNITVSGSALIDDTRLYPPSAAITSYTYSATGSQLSVTDANNVTLYKEYDGLNRLKLVRDEHRNIINHYCYNYAGQQEKCVTIYYNKEQSKLFVRNDCPAGFVGGSYTYTIAAGKYSSFISQADVDNKATNDLIVNGQTAANASGTCNPNQVFAKMTEENFSYNATQVQADIVIRFYADAACTIPVVVNNLTVAYERHGNCVSPYSATFVCNGNTVILEKSFLIDFDEIDPYDGGTHHCSQGYGLEAGNGYIIK